VEVELYDRGPWQLCLEENCSNLFTDDCLGPAVCARAVKRAAGIQIFVALPGQDARYVTTVAKRH
jgi:hypothetical protein